MQLVNLKLYILFMAIETGVTGNKLKRIVYGEYSHPTEIPYIVSLRTGNFHFCGGSIISYYHILTAAHCLDQTIPRPPFVFGQSYVITGTTMRKYNGTKHEIRSYYSHPYFSMDPKYLYKYDIAIITLHCKIEMNEHQMMIRLPVSPLPPRSAGMVAGWGDQYFRSQQGSDMLLKLETTVMNGEECHKHRTFDQDTQSIVCSLVEVGRRGGTCQGDSGGPLVVFNTLVGVVSNGEKCAAGRPDVFTSVYYYKDWILQALSQSGVPYETKDMLESGFYDKDKVKKLHIEYGSASKSSTSASQIAYYSYVKGKWYAVLY